MRKANVATFIGIAALAAATPALAGSTFGGGDVQLLDNFLFFSGSPAVARASSDTNEFIGCYIVGNISSGLFGTCSATDASGATRMCSFDAHKTPELGQALATLTAYSSLSVSYDIDGNCVQIEVDNWSYNPPVVR